MQEAAPFGLDSFVVGTRAAPREASLRVHLALQLAGAARGEPAGEPGAGSRSSGRSRPRPGRWLHREAKVTMQKGAPGESCSRFSANAASWGDGAWIYSCTYSTLWCVRYCVLGVRWGGRTQQQVPVGTRQAQAGGQRWRYTSLSAVLGCVAFHHGVAMLRELYWEPLAMFLLRMAAQLWDKAYEIEGGDWMRLALEKKKKKKKKKKDARRRVLRKGTAKGAGPTRDCSALTTRLRFLRPAAADQFRGFLPCQSAQLVQ
jgi:hypothetical protein